MKNILRVFSLLFLLGVAYGFTIPSYEGYVTDKVGVFSTTEKAALTDKITELEKTTSVELAVLVVPTVDDDINLAAADVGNQWGVGKKGQNNGLVVLIAVDDKKWSIQVGYGLEGTLPDLVAKNIGEARFPTNFRAGKYYQGVDEMIDDVSGYINQDPTIVKNYSQDTTAVNEAANAGSSLLDRYGSYVFFFFFLVVISFGRLITVPTSNGKGRKMKKYGRRIFTSTGVVISLLFVWFFANILLSVCISYAVLFFGLAIAMKGKSGGKGGMRFGGTGGIFGGGGGSFGGFGGGGFGGGGGGGSR